jgi:hypothetical protein
MTMTPELLVGILAFAGSSLFAMLVWSLKRNLDALEDTIHELKVQAAEMSAKHGRLELEIKEELAGLRSDVARLLKRRSR